MAEKKLCGGRMEDRWAQVQVIPALPSINGLTRVLLLKRAKEKGGFWQPVTGGIRPGELPVSAAHRELREETGFTADIIDDGYSFTFEDTHHGNKVALSEFVVVGVIRNQNISDIRLSDEHTDYALLEPNDALDRLEYESNRLALLHYKPTIERLSDV